MALQLKDNIQWDDDDEEGKQRKEEMVEYITSPSGNPRKMVPLQSKTDEINLLKTIARSEGYSESTISTYTNKIGSTKKFIKVKLNGWKENTVAEPSRKGVKYKIMNLLLRYFMSINLNNLRIFFLPYSSF